MRQILEKHHAALTCATCHRTFEPMGLAMENFEATGAWRSDDEGQPIDNTGILAMGRSSMNHELAERPDQVSGSIRARSGRKLLTYALGRGLEYQGHAAGPDGGARVGGQSVPVSRHWSCRS
jgi:hypothetical protein